ncbi:hypothetical protein L484_025468 [Morus notabilis]|uniref:Uncharacterized protein n=1 Tax=Morus notabilis TaxID=981085 RepID=W9RZF0_9ROSA|nr:hypothetical protein L484_025468 [Morus notabilis]
MPPRRDVLVEEVYERDRLMVLEKRMQHMLKVQERILEHIQNMNLNRNQKPRRNNPISELRLEVTFTRRTSVETSRPNYRFPIGDSIGPSNYNSSDISSSNKEVVPLAPPPTSQTS